MSYKYEVLPSQRPANPVLAKIKIVQLIFFPPAQMKELRRFLLCGSEKSSTS